MHAGLNIPDGSEGMLREKLESDPTAFTITMMKSVKQNVPGEEEGDEFVNQKEKDDALAAATELEKMFK